MIDEPKIYGENIVHHATIALLMVYYWCSILFYFIYILDLIYFNETTLLNFQAFQKKIKSIRKVFFSF